MAYILTLQFHDFLLFLPSVIYPVKNSYFSHFNRWLRPTYLVLPLRAGCEAKLPVSASDHNSRGHSSTTTPYYEAVRYP